MARHQDESRLLGAKDEIARTGVTYMPSAYADPYPITKHLIEEGRSHLLEGRPFAPGCKVRILQGMRDADVPWRHALALVGAFQRGFERDLDDPRRWQYPDDQPDTKFGGPLLNNYRWPWPPDWYRRR